MGKKGWLLDTGLPIEMVDWVRFAALTKNMIYIIIFFLGSTYLKCAEGLHTNYNKLAVITE